MMIRIFSISPILLAVLMAVPGCGDNGGGNTTEGTRTYLAEPAFYISEPTGFSSQSDLLSFVPAFLLQVKGSSVTIAPTKKDTTDQDLCSPTAKASLSSNKIGPINFPLYITNKPAGADPVTVKTTIKNLSFTKILPQNGAPSQDGEFTATIDARELYHLVTLLGTNRTADTMCNTLQSSMQVTCQPCGDSQPYCLDLKATEFGAEESSSSVKTIAEADMASDCPQPTQ